ncbi:MAG: hypothetical protein HYV05_01310 [Deltaproteobacteria bacterium]|nr:hypothetical protein [Deltaproteobacteria bacterium]MBI2347270.1 hypothetical protein [Deltaproteobacteria bacterium]
MASLSDGMARAERARKALEEQLDTINSCPLPSCDERLAASFERDF